MATRYIQGNNEVQGSNDGVAPAAGYVGEKKTWVTAPATVATAASMGSPADWTNATITLEAGIWQINANILVGLSTGAAAGANTDFCISITDSSNVVIQNQAKTSGLKTPANATAATKFCLSFSFIENLNTSKTYKIRYQQTDAVAAGGGTVFNQGGFYSEFYAVRIA